MNFCPSPLYSIICIPYSLLSSTWAFTILQNSIHIPSISVSVTEKIINCDVPKDKYLIPKYPLILCHGFSGFDRLLYIPVLTLPNITDLIKKLKKEDVDSPKVQQVMNADNEPNTSDKGVYLFEYWNGIKSSLESHGCKVFVAKVPPFGSIENRAKALHNFIERSIENSNLTVEKNNMEPIKVNLIAHSMGGLDCRYLISALEKKNYEVMSLTTISTPHRGTSVADFALKYTPSNLINSQFPSIRQLSTTSCSIFNKTVLNDPNVLYFSYGSSFKPNPTSMFFITWQIINRREGPNDGMVSLKSCKWGKFLGHLEDVDHADLINWMGVLKKTKIAMGIPTFNPMLLYLDIADNLARNGL